MGTERCDGILRSLDGRALKTAVAAVVVAVALSGLVSAAPIDDGVEAAKRGDYATAMRILRPLAIKGDPRAQYNLGVIYDEGLGVQPDYSAAFSWYLKAANQGYASAQANLGSDVLHRPGRSAGLFHRVYLVLPSGVCGRQGRGKKLELGRR